MTVKSVPSSSAPVSSGSLKLELQAGSASSSPAQVITVVAPSSQNHSAVLSEFFLSLLPLFLFVSHQTILLLYRCQVVDSSLSLFRLIMWPATTTTAPAGITATIIAPESVVVTHRLTVSSASCNSFPNCNLSICVFQKVLLIHLVTHRMRRMKDIAELSKTSPRIHIQMDRIMRIRCEFVY